LDGVEGKRFPSKTGGASDSLDRMILWEIPLMPAALAMAIGKP